jgi:hypothetical protein
VPRRAAGLLIILLCLAPCALAGGDAPAWMHALVNAPSPAHDEKTNAVLLYSEENVVVYSSGKVKTQVREAYKILRPEGRDFGIVHVTFNPQRKVSDIRGWCIPAQGRDYEVKDKDAVQTSLSNIAGSDLVTDVMLKMLPIPAADPGNIVGYEYEVEETPLVLQEDWAVQEESPAREKHFRLLLPPGWEFKASWINMPEVKPVKNGEFWEWSVADVKGIREEAEMPPYAGVVGQMIVSFYPPGGHDSRTIGSWKEMGDWYRGLVAGRRDAGPAIKAKVAELTAAAPTQLEKMRAIAAFVQAQVRYVSIQLGIGGYQPHPADAIFSHRFGDCKDKVTLASSMLHEIGVESYYVVINTERGSVTQKTPAYVYAFDHMILAVRLPNGLSDPSLVATMTHPTLGRLLFYDPTSELTPFGQIGGYLQANMGLLVAPEGGELVQLPQLAAELNGLRRSGVFKLSEDGFLEGDVDELRYGDHANGSRQALRNVSRDVDRIKPMESLLADSLTNFHIHKASLVNAPDVDLPMGYRYSFTSMNYAKHAGELLMVRPRVLGSKSSSLLEKPEPRVFPVEFDGLEQDTDVFEITLPAGYEVDELPPPVNADYSFASYHAKSEVKGNVIRYARTLTLKELSVPASRSDELKRFYRIIHTDERSTAVLRPAKSH